MNKSQTAELLAYAHSTLGGETNDLEVESWHDAIGALDAEDAASAARWLCARSERMIRPGDVLRRVRAQRNERAEKSTVAGVRDRRRQRDATGKPPWFDTAVKDAHDASHAAREAHADDAAVRRSAKAAVEAAVRAWHDGTDTGDAAREAWDGASS